MESVEPARTQEDGTADPAQESAQDAATSGTDQPNPFWSERASDEFRLRQARPLGLAEFDDVQLEPDYQASEAGRSAGYASARLLAGNVIDLRSWELVRVVRKRPQFLLDPGRQPGMTFPV